MPLNDVNVRPASGFNTANEIHTHQANGRVNGDYKLKAISNISPTSITANLSNSPLPMLRDTVLQLNNQYQINTRNIANNNTLPTDLMKRILKKAHAGDEAVIEKYWDPLLNYFDQRSTDTLMIAQQRVNCPPLLKAIKSITTPREQIVRTDIQLLTAFYHQQVKQKKQRSPSYNAQEIQQQIRTQLENNHCPAEHQQEMTDRLHRLPQHQLKSIYKSIRSQSMLPSQRSAFLSALQRAHKQEQALDNTLNNRALVNIQNAADFCSAVRVERYIDLKTGTLKPEIRNFYLEQLSSSAQQQQNDIDRGFIQ